MAFPLLSEFADPRRTQTSLYCVREQDCGHRVKLNVRAAIKRYGDLRSDEFKRRLRCSKYGARARMITSYE